jgi:hypothetical protein
MARCACPPRAPSLGSLWRETRIATRKYATRPAASESGMSIGALGRLERRPSAKGDVWKQFHDTYPDAGNRFRTYTTRKEYGSEQSGRAKRTLGAVYLVNEDGSVSDTPMTGQQVMQAYGQTPVWGESGDWSGTTLATNIAQSAEAEVNALANAWHLLGVNAPNIAAALGQVTFLAGIVLTGIVLVETVPLIVEIVD